MRTIAVLLCVLCSCWLTAQNTQDYEDHTPFVDADGDYFCPEHSSPRGADWRGRDADDNDPNVYPGCYDEHGGEVDNNCNGIYGKVPGLSLTYEQKFSTNGVQSRGVVIFGDSAAAAFHIPEEWFDRVGLTPQYKELLYPPIRNEFDWPHKSWATGFDPEIGNQSIYMKMRERNLVNHRDYQNLGVNGAESEDLVDQVALFARSPQDKPVLAFIAYIGNDICKRDLESMTTPEEFEQSILEGLAALDKKIPSNSKVVLMGLVDGRVLWDTMYDEIHPLGITYEQLYQFLTRINGNPCQTWLTNDETSRNKASERAAELSAVMQQIATTQVYQNFDMTYIDMKSIVDRAFNDWLAQGNNPADLIEAVDGFHPSHTGHRLFADYIWEQLEQNNPDFIGPENPYNAEIQSIFGDQGGH